MISRSLTFWVVLLWFGAFQPFVGYGQWSQSELNLSYKYNPNADYTLECQPIADTDSLTLFVKFQVKNLSYNLYDFEFDFFQPASLATKLTNPLPKQQIDSTFLAGSNQGYSFEFRLPNYNLPWLVIRVFNKKNGYNYYFDFAINNLNTTQFILRRDNEPWLKSFTDPYHRFTANRPITLFYYNHVFNNALPPMVTTDLLPEKSIKVDSSFSINANSYFRLLKEGLYFIQTDTSIMRGRGLLVTGKYFPKPSTLDQLIEPLVYITTKKEKQRLENITEKKEFDQFWLDLTKSPDRAKRIIKEFYDRVAHANATFSTYKPGWKTDMGMIYIIFGLPSEVIKNDNEETWVYINHPIVSNTKFKFIKTNNVFSSSHYVLIRDKKYDDVWFRAVDLWRKGRF